MKMVKVLATILLAMNLLVSFTYGASVSYDDAKNVALNLIYSKTGESATIDDSALDLSTDKEVYLIRMKPKGWVIVSGDNSIEPVLAYSLESPLSTTSSLPAGFIAWMDNVESQIKEVKNADMQSNTSLKEKWDHLKASPDDYMAEADNSSTLRDSTIKGPLLTTQWGQKGFYNDKCPGYSSNEQVLTGSAATAIAQIMNYHKQPSVGIGSHSYTSKTHEFDLSVSFGKSTYKWIDMSNEDIARIIYHAGVAVDTDYGYDASGAYASRISPAFRDYFGYQSSDFEKKSDHNDTSWHTKVKTNIDNKLPIIYHNNYGHKEKGNFFVIDGYSIGFSGNKYHINWGQRGAVDGWYGLDVVLDQSDSDYVEGAVFDISSANEWHWFGVVSDKLSSSYDQEVMSAISAEAMTTTSTPLKPTHFTASDGTSTEYVTFTGYSEGNERWEVWRSSTINGTKTRVVDVLINDPTFSKHVDGTGIPGVKYYYAMKACNSSGCSVYSDYDTGWRAKPVSPAPATPSVSATDGTLVSGVVISFYSANAAFYKVYRNGGYLDLVYERSYKDTRSNAGTVYTYSAKACNSAGECSGLGYDKGWRAKEKSTIPAIPSVTATDGTLVTGVVISFYSPNTAFYKIYRRSSNSTLGYLDLVYERSYKDTDAWPGKEYTYAVKACNGGGECSGLGYDKGSRASGIPAIPRGVSATDGTLMSGVVISWDKVYQAQGYLVYRDGEYIGGTTYLSFKDTKAWPGRRYNYSVKAKNQYGKSNMSASNVGWKLSGIPTEPYNIKASDGTWVTNVSISWDSSYRPLYMGDPSTFLIYRNGEYIGSSYSRNFADRKAFPGRKYNYSVVLKNKYGKSPMSASDVGWRDTGIPDRPEYLRASNGGYPDVVWLKWKLSRKATSYLVYRDGEYIGISYSDGFADRKAYPGKKYNYTVKAKSSYGKSDISDPDTGWRQAPVPRKPRASKGLWQTGVTVGDYAVPYATYYKIYRAKTPNGSKEYLDLTEKTSYKDTTGALGYKYYYFVKVCSKDYSGCSAYSPYDIGWRPTLYAPSNQASDGTLVSGVVVNLYWTSGATHYKIARSDSAQGPKEYLDLTEKTSYKDTTGWPGTKYYYFVKACNSGGCGEYGHYNVGSRAALVPSKPTTVSATNGTLASGVVIGSYEVGQILQKKTFYKIYRATSTRGDRTYLDLTYALSYKDTEGRPGTKYYYFVKACNSDDCSDMSDPAIGMRKK